jgi:chromosome segregation ATPase
VAAEQAREAAADTFLALDSAQRDLRLSLATVRAVEEPGVSGPLVDRFAELGQAVDAASLAYIEEMDRHQLDPEVELESREYESARAALDRSREGLLQVNRELERFGASLAPLLARADAALAQVPPAVERARQGVASARAAVHGAEAAGMGGAELAARLAAVESSLAELEQGPAVHGVAGSLRLAAQLEEASGRLFTEAERLPRLRQDTANRLSSLRTRAQAVASKVALVDPALSELRRGFAETAWGDLERVPERVRRALEVAGARIDEAAEAAARQEWADAVSRLSTARASLNDADEAVASVRDRLEALKAVSADPQGEVERTRFALRDAQRFAMAGRAAVEASEAAYVGELDALVFRLEATEQRAGEQRPDWWRFLRENEAIRRSVAEVVGRIREGRAVQ